MKNTFEELYWNTSQALIWIMFRDIEQVEKASDQGGSCEPETSPVLESIDSMLGVDESPDIKSATDKLKNALWNGKVDAYFDGKKLEAIWFDGASIDYGKNSNGFQPRITKSENEFLDGRKQFVTREYPIRLLGSQIKGKWPAPVLSQVHESPYDNVVTDPYMSLYEAFFWIASKGHMLTDDSLLAKRSDESEQDLLDKLTREKLFAEGVLEGNGAYQRIPKSVFDREPPPFFDYTKGQLESDRLKHGARQYGQIKTGLFDHENWFWDGVRFDKMAIQEIWPFRKLTRTDSSEPTEKELGELFDKPRWNLAGVIAWIIMRDKEKTAIVMHSKKTSAGAAISFVLNKKFQQVDGKTGKAESKTEIPSENTVWQDHIAERMAAGKLTAIGSKVDRSNLNNNREHIVNGMIFPRAEQPGEALDYFIGSERGFDVLYQKGRKNDITRPIWRNISFAREDILELWPGLSADDPQGEKTKESQTPEPKRKRRADVEGDAKRKNKINSVLQAAYGKFPSKGNYSFDVMATDLVLSGGQNSYAFSSIKQILMGTYPPMIRLNISSKYAG